MWTQEFMAVIWMMLPMMNMMTPTESDFRRPNQSEVLCGSVARPDVVTRQNSFWQHSLCTREGTNEGTDRHKRDEEGFKDGHELVGLSGRFGLASRESVSKVGKDEHTRNLSSVVSKEETTDGGDASQQDGFGTTVGAVDVH